MIIMYVINYKNGVYVIVVKMSGVVLIIFLVFSCL